jgi:hypothetical protein
VNLSLLRIFRFQKRAIRLVCCAAGGAKLTLLCGCARRALCPLFTPRKSNDTQLEHDPGKHAIGLDPRAETGFSEKIRLHQEALAIGVEDRIA